MPQREKPLKARTKEDEASTGKPTERQGKHKEQDEALPDKDSTKDGLNEDSGKER